MEKLAGSHRRFLVLLLHAPVTHPGLRCLCALGYPLTCQVVSLIGRHTLPTPTRLDASKVQQIFICPYRVAEVHVPTNDTNLTR